MKDCLITHRVAGAKCDTCGGPADPLHVPMKLMGIHCARCCPACTKPEGKQEERPEPTT